MVIHHLVRDGAGKVIDTEIVAINDAWRRYLHLEGKDVAGIRLSRNTLIWPIHGKTMIDLYRQVDETGEAASEDVFYPPDKKYFTVTISRIAPDYMAAAFHEVTELMLHSPVQRSIFNSVSDAIFVIDVDTGLILDVNRKGEELAGCPQEALVGREAIPDEPEEYTRTRLEALRRVRAGEAEYHTLVAHPSPQGTRWLDVRVQAAVAVDQKRMVMLLQDVTETRRQLQALTESQERYRAVSEIFSDYALAITVDPNERLSLDWVTDAFTIITGYSEEEAKAGFLSGAKEFLFKLIHPDDHGTLMESYRQALERGSSECDYRLFDQDGGTRWVYSSLKAVPLDGGGFKLYGMVKDVSDRIQAENTYLSIFNGVNDSIFVHDIETGRYLDVNIRGAMMTGYPRDEIIDRLRLPHETYNTARRRASLIHRAALGEVVENEAIYRGPDGQERWIESRFKVATIGGQRRVICVSRDTTERHHSIEALIQSDQRNRVISSLISDTAFQIARAPDQTWAVDWITGPYHEMTGYTFEDIQGILSQADDETILNRFIHPDDTWKIARDVSNARSTAPVIVEFRLMRKNRSPVWVRGYFRPTLKHRRLVALAGAFQDITGQLQATRNYRALFEAAADATLILDPADGSVLDANQKGDSLLIASWTGNPESLRLDAVFKDLKQDELLELLRLATAGNAIERVWETRSVQPARYDVRLLPVDLGDQRRVIAVFRDVSAIRPLLAQSGIAVAGQAPGGPGSPQ
jgi:PAS domain S-box-containing protein